MCTLYLHRYHPLKWPACSVSYRPIRTDVTIALIHVSVSMPLYARQKPWFYSLWQNQSKNRASAFDSFDPNHEDAKNEIKFLLYVIKKRLKFKQHPQSWSSIVPILTWPITSSPYLNLKKYAMIQPILMKSFWICLKICTKKTL